MKIWFSKKEYKYDNFLVNSVIIPILIPIIAMIIILLMITIIQKMSLPREISILILFLIIILTIVLLTFKLVKQGKKNALIFFEDSDAELYVFDAKFINSLKYHTRIDTILSLVKVHKFIENLKKGNITEEELKKEVLLYQINNLEEIKLKNKKIYIKGEFLVNGIIHKKTISFYNGYEDEENLINKLNNKRS